MAAGARGAANGGAAAPGRGGGHAAGLRERPRGGNRGAGNGGAGNGNGSAGNGNAAEQAGRAVLGLLPLASARPGEAMVRARAILASGRPPFEASVAHQVIGMLLREFDDLGAASAHLSAALKLARASGSAGRQADVLATLGVALTYQGHTRRAQAAFSSALRLAGGTLAGQILVRRAISLFVLGRHREALDDLSRAIRVLRPAGEPIWEARALTARALVHLACGSARRAELDLGRAERLFATTSQTLEVALTWHNRGLVAFRAADVPAALACLDEASRRYRALGVRMPDLAIDRCAVLLAAGLPTDALALASEAVRGFPSAGGRATKKAELLLCAARAALAAGQPAAAIACAQSARRMFGAQGRPWWQAHAGLLLVQARFEAGPASGRLLRQAGQAADGLDLLGSADAPQARLLAGRLALALGRSADAGRHLTAAARVRRRRVPALARAHGWLAEALRASTGPDRRRLLAACARGFAALDEHQLTLGASELRAQATAQGAELAALAQRAALASGRPRLLLAWSERWRATAQAIPPARPADDGGLQADLTALRDATSRLERARDGAEPTAALQREQRRLEAAVRARVLRARGGGQRGGYRFDTGAFLAALGTATLIQIVEVDGDLHLLVCGGGRVRRLRAGRIADAAREVDFARFGLRALAHGRGGGLPAAALATLRAAGDRLEAALLGAAGRHLGDGAVIVVPPGKLHAVPWGLLPSLSGRATGVAPSARAWLQAHGTVPPTGGVPVLIRGPRLGASGGEVPALAAHYPGATVLGWGTATAERVLRALDGAPLAHVAAHGTFRADSPLFSSLQLDDGPLTVHDLERLRRAPYRMILSSCDSAVLAPAGADELLGLTSSLAPLGTAGIVASVGPVNDRASVTLMTLVHGRLRQGASLAEALLHARAGAGADPVLAATAWSFIALGAR
jgi:tetratricopeptide (TPR) repeat protein